MAADIRARYEAWVRRRILRRVVRSCVLLLALSMGLILGLGNGGNMPCGLFCSNEVDDHDELLDQPVVSLQPTYQDFDFSTYNEDAIVEIDAAYLNSYLILVNKVFRLPEDYVPEDLVVPKVLSAWGHDNTNHRMREVAARALEDMFDAARDDAGLILWAVSGYRSFEDQTNTHRHCLGTYGCDEAEKKSARPGHSEHQTGLTMDVTAASVGGILTQEFSNTPEGIWLVENAHRFGFIIRYPYGRINLTGIVFEPWHIRYVGTSAATYIFENGLVLEQYIFPAPR